MVLLNSMTKTKRNHGVTLLIQWDPIFNDVSNSIMHGIPFASTYKVLRQPPRVKFTHI